jgi:hypothetical protein
VASRKCSTCIRETPRLRGGGLGRRKNGWRSLRRPCLFSGTELSEHAVDKTASRWVERRRLLALFQRGKGALDFTLVGKTASLGLREDELAVHEHVELPLGADLDFGFDPEAFLEGGGQTDRARLVPSSVAIEDFDGHQ